ncbi:MAG: FUSC family protein [Geminicoccaceae bacterium]|nr:FUSC family protein [Geminicoccaceae bacterium]
MNKAHRLQEAFKIALAMVIAVGLSLSLGWENPKWAMLAVATCTLSTGGESLHKGLMRIAGTIIAIIVTLGLLALFIQERWAYALMVMTWIGICAWNIQESRVWYIWLLSGFCVPLLTFYSDLESQHAFEIMMLRLQQTCLGIVTYTLVASFIFPAYTRDVFTNDILSHVGHLRTAWKHLVRGFLAGPDGRLAADEAEKLKRAILQLQESIKSKLDAAAIENFDILESGRAWERLTSEMFAFTEAVERWRLGFNELHEDGSQAGISGTGPFFDEITRRLEETEGLLTGGNNFTEPRDVALAVSDKDDTRSGRSIFSSGALALTLIHLKEIDRASAALLMTAAEIRKLTTGHLQDELDPPSLPSTVIPDPERVAATVRSMSTFALAFISFVLFPELPSASMLLILGTVISLFLAPKPWLPLKEQLIAQLVTAIFGGSLHIFIMPHLWSYLGLGTMLFIVTFLIHWLFPKPTQNLPRFVGLANMSLMIQLNNQQSYDFLYIANFSIALCLPFIVLAITTSIPVSFHPEDAFNRLLHRFFGSTLKLLESLKFEHRNRQGWWQRQVHAYHLRQVNSIPQKLEAWVAALPPGAVGPNGREDFRHLADAIAIVSRRLLDLMALRDAELDSRVVERILPVIRQWRLGVQQVCVDLVQSPGSLDGDDLAGRLSRRLNEVHDIARQALEDIADDPDFERSEHNVVRELGAFRGISEAIVVTAGSATRIDWQRLNETRL